MRNIIKQIAVRDVEKLVMGSLDLAKVRCFPPLRLCHIMSCVSGHYVHLPCLALLPFQACQFHSHCLFELTCHLLLKPTAMLHYFVTPFFTC